MLLSLTTWAWCLMTPGMIISRARPRRVMFSLINTRVLTLAMLLLRVSMALVTMVTNFLLELLHISSPLPLVTYTFNLLMVPPHTGLPFLRVLRHMATPTITSSR